MTDYLAYQPDLPSIRFRDTPAPDHLFHDHPESPLLLPTCRDERTDQVGCIDGRWYVGCGARECEGYCIDVADCPCTGCDEEVCCARDDGGAFTGQKQKEPLDPKAEG